MKIVTVIGARPQFVKAAVVSRAFARHREITEVIIHTGQHFDNNMSDIFFEEMSIPKPDYNLNISGLNHGAMTGQMLERIEEILLKETPDWVVVYGDTNSTLAGALAAKKLHTKVAHIEAGLRSFNMDMPEEINRILTDRISNILFCPTQQALVNLKQEGYGNIATKVINSGDVMQDAALFYTSKAVQPILPLPDNFILATVHRAENTDNVEKLTSIFRALEKISQQIMVIIPLHPRTRQKLSTLHFDFNNSAIRFIDPVGYLEMVWMLKNCSLVMTDSGGLQKEAYFFHKYCVTLRTETEWVELTEHGFNVIAGWQEEPILDCFNQMHSKKNSEFNTSLYGNGHAGEKIIEELLKA